MPVPVMEKEPVPSAAALLMLSVPAEWMKLPVKAPFTPASVRVPRPVLVTFAVPERELLMASVAGPATFQFWLATTESAAAMAVVPEDAALASIPLAPTISVFAPPLIV